MTDSFSKKSSFLEFLKLVSPAIISMVFISLYTIIDGIFVSQLVGSDALASINIILPIINVIFGIGIMMATGGSAIVAIRLGEKKEKLAKEGFSLIFYVSIVISIILSIISFSYTSEISKFLGATETLLPYCIAYGRIMILFTPFFIIKTLLEFFIRTDGNFKFSLFISIIGGIINIVLDYVFIKSFNLGITGAALATGLGVLISSIIGILYFFTSKSNLKFVKCKFDLRLLGNTMINGSSEMVTELSTGITTLIFNMLALKYAGENGVAALTIVLYAHFLMVSTYLGFSSGVAPLISYNYGGKNHSKLKELLKYSKIFILISSVLIFTISLVFAPFIVEIFVTKGTDVYNLALHGLKVFSIAFIFVGVNIFASGLFTALSNGKISAIISFARAFVFIILGSIILPPILEMNGLWLIVPFAEILSLALSIFYIKKYSKKIFFNT